MDKAHSEVLLAHLAPEGPRGRVLRAPFAAAARDHLVIRRGRLVVAYGDDEVRALSAHPSLSIPTPVFPPEVGAAVPTFVDRFTRTLSFLPPVDHARLRGLVVRHFTPRTLQATAGDVDTVVRMLIDAAAEAESVDLITEIADPLPVRATAMLIGAPAEAWPWLDRIGHGMLARISSTYQGASAARCAPVTEHDFREFYDYLRDLLHHGELSAHSIGATLRESVYSGEASEDDALGLLVLLYMTGVDTVAATVGNAALNLLERPDLAPRIASDPALAGAFVDEVLRLDPPLPYGVRAVRERVQIGDIHLSPGDQVLLCYAAANLDPRRHPDPLSFRLEGRRPALSFGHGLHRCLGAALARIQTTAAITQLARRGITMAQGFVPIWRPEPSIHTIASLAISLRPARSFTEAAA